MDYPWFDCKRTVPLQSKKDCLFAIMDSSYSPYRFNLVDGWGIWWGLPRPTLSETLSSRYDGLQAALRLRLRLHGVVHDMPSPMVGLGGMGGKTAWSKLLHPCGETAIFRVLVGSHPLHAKACTYLWAAFVWGGVLNERAVITNS